MAPPGVGAMNFANLGIDEQRDARGRRRRVRVADPMDQRPCNHCDVSSIGEHLKEWEDGIGGNGAVKDWPASACASTTCKRDGLCHCLRDLVNSGEQHATAIRWVE